MHPVGRLFLWSAGILGAVAIQLQLPVPSDHRRSDGEIPIVLVIDTNGDGVSLSTPKEGVNFPFGHGQLARTAWTKQGSDDAFMIRDRDRNGVIDGIGDLLGGSGPPNGFDFLRALDGWATPEEIGRAQHSARRPDGRIDRADAIMLELGLWTDMNHNGRSEEHELQSLSFAGFDSIDLHGVQVGLRDDGGNLVVEKSKIVRVRNSRRLTVDVIAVRLAPGAVEKATWQPPLERRGSRDHSPAR